MRDPSSATTPKSGRTAFRSLLLTRTPIFLAAFGALTWMVFMGWAGTQLNQHSDGNPKPSAASSPMKSDPRAAELLRKVAARLDGLQDLEVSVTSEHLAGTSPDEGLRETATAENTFQREDQIWRIVGKTAPVYPWDPESGSRYHLRSDTAGTTVTIAVVSGGRPERFDTLSEGLSALSGVTRQTSNLIPDLVLPLPFEEPKWNPTRVRFLRFLEERAAMEPDETIDGHACFRVNSAHDSSTWVLWIDKELMLPRKVKQTQDAEQRKRREPPFGGSFSYIECEHRIKFSVPK